MEGILKEHSFSARAFSWEQLAYKAGIEDQYRDIIAGKTIKRVIGRIDYHKCIACKKEWVSNSITTRYISYALAFNSYASASNSYALQASFKLSKNQVNATAIIAFNKRIIGR
ncbi:hypothetical protein BU16DRAFT_595712 [Lophium mytilinum]|uniref:Uncharacterized protein n=1 Tax=Lophium mytilinum TaxID=390894 RepID=A0A6A6QHT6_9PEZI|nr:hypothetical protein BU16DRAFT_595712 [Lophium mytilinum]